MATATTLEEAANEADDNMFPFFVSAGLQARVTNFAQAGLALFADTAPRSRPVANWFTVLARVADLMSTPPTLPQYEQAMDYVYRCCHMGQALLNQGDISAPNAAAMLASYNAQF